MTTVSTHPPSGTRALGTPIDQIGVAYAGLPGNLIANAVEFSEHLQRFLALLPLLLGKISIQDFADCPTYAFSLTGSVSSHTPILFRPHNIGAPITLLLPLHPDRNWAIVGDFHQHVRAEIAGLCGNALRPQQFSEALHQWTGDLRRGGVSE